MPSSLRIALERRDSFKWQGDGGVRAIRGGVAAGHCRPLHAAENHAFLALD